MWTPRGATRERTAGRRTCGTGLAGIGTRGLTPTRLSPPTESSGIRSDGASIRPGMHSELLISDSGITDIRCIGISGPATVPLLVRRFARRRPVMRLRPGGMPLSKEAAGSAAEDSAERAPRARPVSARADSAEEWAAVSAAADLEAAVAANRGRQRRTAARNREIV